MASPFLRVNVPEPPSDAKGLTDWAKQFAKTFRDHQLEVHKALQAAETVATLQVIGVAPERSNDGDEVEVNATLGATGAFGSGAGKYVRRSGAWVFIG